MSTLTDQRTYAGAITIITCWCGIRCGVPKELHDHQMRCHDDPDRKEFSIYCPLGHSFIPAGRPRHEVDAEKLQTAKDSASFWRHREQSARAEAARERRSAAAYKGHLTRMQNRVARGVCPKAGCKRHFTNLQEHVQSEHPDLLDDLNLSHA